MPTPTRTVVLATFIASAACAHSQHPAGSGNQAAAAKMTEALVRALEAEGQVAEVADGPAGVVVTAWTDTGYRVRLAPMEDSPARDLATAVYRRYRLRLVEDSSGAAPRVRIEVEAKRCPPDSLLGLHAMLSSCEEVNDLSPGLRGDRDALQLRIQHAVRMHAERRDVQPNLTVTP